MFMLLYHINNVREEDMEEPSMNSSQLMYHGLMVLNAVNQCGFLYSRT